RPPDPERLEVDSPGAVPLRKQEAGDQVAADREEDLDAQEAARQPVEPGVIDQHSKYGDGAKSIEAGQVAESGPWLGRSRRSDGFDRAWRLGDGFFGIRPLDEGFVGNGRLCGGRKIGDR